METINDFSGLANLKEKLKAEEPIRGGSTRTEAMLTSAASRKLFNYFLSTYPDILKKIVKKDPRKEEEINALVENLKNDKKLSGGSIFFLDTLYSKFLKKVPISQSANKGVVFGDIIRRAGCDAIEAEEARKILDAFIEPALKNYFEEKGGN